MANIISLQSLKEDSVNLVGEKIMFLARIGKETDASIPLGFVITDEVYDRFINSADIKPKIESLMKQISIEDPEKLQNIANEIQKLVISTHLPRDVSEDIIDAYESLSIGPNLSWNSMIAHFHEPVVFLNPYPVGETDTGAHLSFPNIRGKQRVLDCVVTSFASNFTAKAIENRLRKDVPDKGMAILIQQMIYPSFSGMASMGYVKDEKDMIITANYGFMNDEVLDMADEYVVDHNKSAIVGRKVNPQPVEFRKRTERDDMIKDNVPADRSRRQKLTDEWILNVAATAKKVFSLSNRSFMFEYMIDKGKIYILQTDEINVPGEDLEDTQAPKEAPDEKEGGKESLATKVEQKKLNLGDDKAEEHEDAKIMIDIKGADAGKAATAPAKSDADASGEDDGSGDADDDEDDEDDDGQDEGLEDGQDDGDMRKGVKMLKGMSGKPSAEEKVQIAKAVEPAVEEEIKAEKKGFFASLFKWKKAPEEKVSDDEDSILADLEKKPAGMDIAETLGKDPEIKDEEDTFVVPPPAETPTLSPPAPDHAVPIAPPRPAQAPPVPPPPVPSVSMEIPRPEQKEFVLKSETPEANDADGEDGDDDNDDSDVESGYDDDFESRDDDTPSEQEVADTLGKSKPSSSEQDTHLNAAKQMLGQSVVSCDMAVSARLKDAYAKVLGNGEGLYLDEMIDALKKRIAVPYDVELRKIRAMRNRFIEQGTTPSADDAKFAFEITEKFLDEFGY